MKMPFGFMVVASMDPGISVGTTRPEHRMRKYRESLALAMSGPVLLGKKS